MTFEEVLLKKEDVAGSNAIFFNGVALEDVPLRLRVSHNACPCCSDLLGEETCCRIVGHEGGGPRLPRPPGCPQGGGSVNGVDLML